MKILVAMSGGVDSSIAAALLKEQGYELCGITMDLWKIQTDSQLGEENPVVVDNSLEDAAAVCEQLGIEHRTVDWKDEFYQHVLGYFKDEYLRGRTPNPCVFCNNAIKFGKMLDYARTNGFDAVATGHYARIIETDGEFGLHRGVDKHKDQSYFLARIRQESLRFIRFPLGGMTKDEVKALARSRNFHVVERSESQDACFMNNLPYTSLLELDDRFSSIGNGDIVDSNGKVLGMHKGYYRYTIGQRHGLGIGAEHPLYVLRIKAENNRIVVGPKEDLLARTISISDINLLAGKPVETPVEISCKLRYRHTPAKAALTAKGEKLEQGRAAIIEFDTPQSAPTPGQSAVFYHENRVLGCGWID